MSPSAVLRNRRKPLPRARRDWQIEARAVHESIGLVLVSVTISAGLYWLLALR